MANPPTTGTCGWISGNRLGMGLARPAAPMLVMESGSPVMERQMLLGSTQPAERLAAGRPTRALVVN